MSDLEYVALVQKGDSTQFGYLVERYSKMCYAVAFRIVKDSDDSQDIVQESFIAAYENIKNFKGESKFSTWLYRIVANKSLALKKKQKYFNEMDDQIELAEDNSEEIDARNEKLVQQALKILPDRERLLIDLFYYQDQSIKDISTILHLSEVNVKVLLYRARNKMNHDIKNSIKFAGNE